MSTCIIGYLLWHACDLFVGLRCVVDNAFIHPFIVIIALPLSGLYSKHNKPTSLSQHSQAIPAACRVKMCNIKIMYVLPTL